MMLFHECVHIIFLVPIKYRLALTAYREVGVAYESRILQVCLLQIAIPN